MKNILILLFLYSCTISYSQTLKTYLGEYKLECIKYSEYGDCMDEEFLNGKATYTYFDTDTGRVYHGSFTFNSKDVNGSGKTFTITGSYKNGLKEGLWVHTITGNNITLSTTTEKRFYNGTEKVSGTFSKGLRNGAWLYSLNQTGKITKINPFNNAVISSYIQTEVITFNATFKNGEFSQTISRNSSVTKNGVVTEKKSFKGQFDVNNFMTGKWIYIDGTTQETLEYDKGIYINYVRINMSTGAVEEKDEKTVTRELLKKYQPGNSDSTGIELCEYCSYGEKADELNKFIRYTPGVAKGNMSQILGNDIRNVGTLTERNEKIAKEKALSEAIEKERIEEKTYYSTKTIEDIENFMKQYPNSKYVQDGQNRIYKFYFDQCKTKEDYIKYVSDFPSSSYDYRIQAIEKIYEFSTSIEDLEFFIKEYPNSSYKSEAVNELRRLKVQKVNDLVQAIKELKNQVDSKYVSYIYNPLTSKSDLATYKKKNLYKKAMFVCDSYLQDQNSCNNNLDSCSENLKQQKKILNKLDSLFEQDTKEIEKQLKDTDDKNEILKILQLL